MSDFILSVLFLILPPRLALERFYIVLMDYAEIFSPFPSLSCFCFTLSVFILRWILTTRPWLSLLYRYRPPRPRLTRAQWYRWFREGTARSVFCSLRGRSSVWRSR